MKKRLIHLGWAVVLFASQAQAQELVPPKLAQSSSAVDPRTKGDRAVVLFELEIDATGAVTNATVVQSSASAELDSAALATVRTFTFEPATKDGQPIPAKIRYEYVFEAKAPPAISSISGVIRDRETGKPIDKAEVVIGTARVITDAQGAFRFDNLPPGPVHLVVTAEGHVTQTLDETLEPNTLTEATLRLETPPDPEAFTATARVDPPAREVTKRTLYREELAGVAGTRGDPLRAVELLPGMTRPAVGGDVPIIRGANPYDSQVFLDGAPVPQLFHFANLSSFMHSRVLDTVELQPSNFSVRYGRKVGGIIEAKVRDPRTDGFHGIAEASLLDTSLLIETPLGDKVSVLAAARRSNIDAFLSAASDSFGDIGITAAPVYWDYQFITAFKPTDQDRIRLLAYGSSDRFGAVYSNPSDIDPALRGNFDLSSVFHRVQLGYRHRFAGGSEQNSELTYGHWKQTGAFGGIGNFDFTQQMIQGRSEWTGVVSPAFRVVGGLDMLGTNLDGRYEGAPPPPDEGAQQIPLSRQGRVAIDADKFFALPGAYVEAGIRPVPQLLISPGVRADYHGMLKEAAVNPRLSTRLEIDATAFKAGIGRFSQTPDERLIVRPIGNPNLGMTHAIHASAGIEHKVTETFTASVEGFAKWVDDIVTTTPGGRAPFFENSQQGRIFGGELLLRMKPRGRFFGFLAYTLMRSERRDAGGEWRVFERDQPHIVNATGVYRIGSGWEVGASIRYTSGVPYTPVVGATYDGTSDVYSPRMGQTYGARNPAYSRFDVRVQKTWTIGRGSVAAYLDVQNVLNMPNREGFSYNYDYSRRSGDRGIPILPILGLRGEL